MTDDEADALLRFARGIPGYGARIQVLGPWLRYGEHYRRSVAEHVHATCMRWRDNGNAGTDLIDFHVTRAEAAAPHLVQVRTFGTERQDELVTLCREQAAAVIGPLLGQATREFYAVHPAPPGSGCAHCTTAATGG